MDLRAYLTQRETLIASAAPGIDSARRLSQLTDDMLRALAEDASAVLPARVRWALIALGGYGCGSLLPSSDLDLLVVSNASTDTLAPFVERLLYPLWDAGLDVGHQVRSKREQLRAVREDIATLTSTLTGRPMAGDERLATDVLAACAKDAAKRSRASFELLASRQRPGSPYLLEPDLKEGMGGRRDFDELTWTAAVATGAPQGGPGPLVSAGYLLPSEAERLERAANTIAAARWELQRMGVGSTMTLDMAEELETDPQTVQDALADTRHLLDRVRVRIRGESEVASPPDLAEYVIELLERGQSSRAEIETLGWSGALDVLVPGFSTLMSLRRPGLAHTLTVGAHCIASALIASEIVTDSAASRNTVGEVAARSAESIDDARMLYVAALVHDIGKEVPGPGHAERGAETARHAAESFGIAQHAEDVADLVRLHLELPETATHQDLDDEDAVLHSARRIGRPGLLAALHILTVADSIATGPAVWTDWHAALVGKLVVRLDDALSPDVDGAGIVQRAEAVRAAALAQVPPNSAESGFLQAAPVRYLADREPTHVVRHALLVASLSGHHVPEAREFEVAAGPTEGTFEVTLAVRDRPRLIEVVAGAFALTGLDILGASAFTVPTGIAVDSFIVQSSTRADIGPDTWARFDRTLSAALKDRLAIGVRLAQRQRTYRQKESSLIEVDVREGPYAAIIRINADDRLGLLYDVARAIGESDLMIVGLTATTRQSRAIDTFRVLDRGGQLPAEGRLGQLSMRLRELG